MQGNGLGLFFIGGVFLLAWLDNGLCLLLGTILLGIIVSCTCQIFERSPNAIYAHKMRAMRQRVMRITDKDLRKKQEAQLKKDLESLAQTEVEDRKGRQDASMVAGLGAFFNPVAGFTWLIGVTIFKLAESWREWREELKHRAPKKT
jgi:hypothetical protein